MTLFALPPGADFARAFAAGFWSRHGALPPEEIARIEILLNNRRSVRAVEAALAEEAPGAVLLPRLAVLAELGADPLAVADPPAIAPLSRLLRLTRLVEAFLAQEEGARVAPLAAAPDLARALAALMDECDEEDVPLAALDRATAGEHADHWSRTLEFLEIIRTAWPAIVAESDGGAPGPKARQRAAVMARIAAWREAPPSHPVIAAASTGSVASTALLLAEIARLPQGAVVLPGFDPGVAPDIWEPVLAGAAPEHPFAPFRRLFSLTGADPAEVAPWAPVPPAPRAALLTQAMRPAPVTDAWHRAGPELGATLLEATAGVSLAEAASPREEAATIALATRQALETPGKTVLILTQDAALARRIGAELDRFAIQPDDSLGRPLADTAPGVFLRLIAEICAAPDDPVKLSGLLMHPLLRGGRSRGAHLRQAQLYEARVLRRRDLGEDLLPDWGEKDPGDREWLADLRGALSPLAGALAAGASLTEIISRHRAAAEALSTAPDAAPEVWEAAAGASASAFLDRFAAAAPAFGDAPVRDYPRLFAQIMRGEEIRPDAATPHPRVALQSPREARVSSADLVILAGLNEGGWPRLAPPDPWLSRPMRAEIGLPSPERAIGLSAHDFLAAASAREVLITRALKEGGSPTVAARWLIRLTTLIAGIEGGAAALSAVRLRGRDLVSLAGRLSRPETRSPSAPRPAPTPPLSARPRRLSVTEIETLVRDPYAIYAKRILGLAPLDPLGRGADFRDRGIVIHRLMERFTRATEAGLPPDPLPLFLETADETLAEAVPFPELRRIWRARIARFAPWFLAGEATRRQNVTRIEVETKGVMTLATPPGFEVTARADRIDLRPEGAAIYDYKAGDPPSKGKIEAGFNQQLHLQAAILEAGGFADLPAATAATGVYMGLTGRGPGGAQVAVKALSKAVEEHSAQLKTLLVAYADPDQGYSSRARVELSTDQGDYDHLARFGEWEAGDD